MKKIIFGLITPFVATFMAFAQQANSPNAADNQVVVTENSDKPRFICSPKHPERAGNCLYSCKDQNRPSATSCVVLPHQTHNADPEYSEFARRKHIQGTVVLEVTVKADGKIADVKVVRSLELSLDQSAVDAVRQWKFDPATVEGKPIPIRLNVEVSFHLSR